MLHVDVCSIMVSEAISLDYCSEGGSVVLNIFELFRYLVDSIGQCYISFPHVCHSFIIRLLASLVKTQERTHSIWYCEWTIRG